MPSSFALSGGTGPSIVEEEQALGRRLASVGLMRRFDQEHVAVYQLVMAGKIGRPILFKGVHRNPMILPYLLGVGSSATRLFTISTLAD